MNTEHLMKLFGHLSGVIAGLLLSFGSCGAAWAHGEDKPGPHGGIVRMPGAYHTEVVPAGAGRIKVYLLDITIQNPSIHDSEVSARIGKGAWVSCRTGAGVFFECAFPDGKPLPAKGRLALKSKRNGIAGLEAVYELPLRIPGPKEPKKHSGH